MPMVVIDACSAGRVPMRNVLDLPEISEATTSINLLGSRRSLGSFEVTIINSINPEVPNTLHVQLSKAGRSIRSQSRARFAGRDSTLQPPLIV